MATFSAMHTEVDVLDAAVEPVEFLFHEWHRRLSRFDDASELSALNRSGGDWFTASCLLREVLERALYWARETDGLFDPTILPALVAAGYDRSFELVAGAIHLTTQPSVQPAGAWQNVEVYGDTIRLPHGVQLDLGGVAKGMAVDRAIAGFARGCVNAGGDLRTVGGGEYLVGVENPLRPERDVLALRIQDRAVATSSTWKRRWQGGHHLIDPRTGKPSTSDAVSVTVIAGTAEEAEVMAKVALLRGLTGGGEWLARRGLAALLIAASGSLLATPGFEDYVVRD